MNVLVLNNHGYGPDEVMIFPESDDRIADARALAEFAESKGYSDEYDDYWVFVGQHVSEASLLRNRAPAGRFA